MRGGGGKSLLILSCGSCLSFIHVDGRMDIYGCGGVRGWRQKSTQWKRGGKKRETSTNKNFPFLVVLSHHLKLELSTRPNINLLLGMEAVLSWLRRLFLYSGRDEERRQKKVETVSSRELFSYFSLNFHFSTSQQRWNFPPNVHRNFRGFPLQPQKPSNEVERNLADGIYYGWSKSKTLFKMSARV